MAQKDKFKELELLERQMRQVAKIANDSTDYINKKTEQIEKRFKRINKQQQKYIKVQNSMLISEKQKKNIAIIAAISGWSIIFVFLFLWLIGG